jgi:ZIP family zinc transporter
MEIAILKYSFFASVVLLIGAGIGSFWKMHEKTLSFVQHFTAGVVFAAVATELLPEILNIHSKLHIAIGFSIGVALVVLLKAWANHLEELPKKESTTFPFGLLAGIGIDLLIDGLLISIAFLSSKETGRLMTLALVLEVLFLALSLSTELTQRGLRLASRGIIFFTFSLLLPLGTALGILILNFLPPVLLTEALSFGAAALLYLVTEELLVEAHETKDTPLVTSSFFLGFLILFLLKD